MIHLLYVLRRWVSLGDQNNRKVAIRSNGFNPFCNGLLWGKIFDAPPISVTRISTTRISAPKRLTVGVNKILFSLLVIGTAFLGQRLVSVSYDKGQ
jgi:hypothetical protein